MIKLVVIDCGTSVVVEESINTSYIIKFFSSEMDIIKKKKLIDMWCNNYNISLKNIAYYGDHEKIKCLANFAMSKSSELDLFLKYVDEINKRYSLKITAVIPSRKGSIRCKNKNIRKFGHTNLLQNKIDILKNCHHVDYILVNTNDEEAIKIAEENNVLYHKREDSLCIGDVPPAKVHVNLATNIDTDIFLYNSPVSPFISSKTIDAIIDYWRNNPHYKIVSASTSIKNFIWENNKPYNFKIDQGIVGTQELSDSYKYACADSGLIGYKEDIVKHQCLFGDGNDIYMYDINELESIDIDWNLDFVISESLFHRSFKTIELVENYMINNSFKETKLLDCTIRDTGYQNHWNWSYETVKDFVYYMGEIGVEYCEIGFFKKEEYVETNSGIWRNLINHLDLVGKLKENTKSKISIMMDIGSLNEDYLEPQRLPPASETGIDLIRVFGFFDILDKSIEVCNALKKKGYVISLNIGHCAHLENDELSHIKKSIKKLDIDYLYFADSLGMLTPNEINKFMIDLKELYPIKNGFHNHNNNGTVFGNLINLLNCNIDILDGTISGFGKNGGNANLEQLIMYLCLKENYSLNIEPLLEFLEKLREVDFGMGDVINIDSIKIMLQQFMNVHSSYLKPVQNENLLTIYHHFNNLENKKKVWK